MKPDFIQAVEEHNLAKVRISLTNELLLDPRGKTFSEMLSYAMSKLQDLFEDNKESNYIVPPQAEWDEKFLFKVKNDIDFNFSKEKLAFYEQVIKIVGKRKAERIEEEEKRKGSSTIYGGEIQQETKRHKINKTYAIISAGGATIALIGIAAGKTMLSIIGGVALVVGGVLLCTYKEEEK